MNNYDSLTLDLIKKFTQSGWKISCDGHHYVFEFGEEKFFAYDLNLECLMQAPSLIAQRLSEKLEKIKSAHERLIK